MIGPFVADFLLPDSTSSLAARAAERVQAEGDDDEEEEEEDACEMNNGGIHD